MNADIEKLLLLQEVDGEILRLNKELARYPGRREERTKEIDRLRAQLKEARAQAQDLERRVRATEVDVAKWRDDLEKFKSQQFRVKTQKEYEALTHEIEETESKISESDEKGLEFLTEEEDIEANIADWNARLEAREAEYETEMERLRQREADKGAEREAYLEKRQETAAGMPPPLVHRYKRLNEVFPGNCVAPLQEGICGGCHMQILQRRVQDLQRSESVGECDSCHRFLYIPDK